MHAVQAGTPGERGLTRDPPDGPAARRDGIVWPHIIAGRDGAVSGSEGGMSNDIRTVGRPRAQ